MSKPLFFVADEQQKVADVFGAEKTAGEAQLSEDHNQWASEILNELYRQVPYVADFEIDVVLDKVDAERGFGFGHIEDRKSTRLNSSHVKISYAVFCLKKKKNNIK